MQSGQLTSPVILNDMFHEFGQDIQFNATGDLQLVNGASRSQQRILRRLLTAILGYTWEPEYGAGIPSFIGQPLSEDLFKQLESLIKSQIGLEQSVAQIPPPVITFQVIARGIYCQIQYTLNPTQQSIVINFPLG